MFKNFLTLFSFLSFSLVLSACSVNPATGNKQFTAFMPASQEAQIGAQEHENIMQKYGLYESDRLQKYVREVGGNIAKGTERKDVTYQFYLLDSPMVNAFASPGGYIYLTRGLLALANSEAEMAGVMAHEIGHVTGRHSAERYSQGVMTSIGSTILSAAIGSSGVSSALSLGSGLYVSSYSRSNENEADSLGLRYLNRAGYDPRAVSWFLSNLRAYSALEAKMVGEPTSDSTNYFATHPATAERVAKTQSEANTYQKEGAVGRDAYLKLIDGLTYGDSADEGFVRGLEFVHPDIGFMFSVPKGFKITNGTNQVVATHKNGAAIIFDIAANKSKHTMKRFLQQEWLNKERIKTMDSMRVNGIEAATTTVEGVVNGKSVDIRLIAIKWRENKVARFQIAIPKGVSSAFIKSLQRSSYSFKAMSKSEKRKARPLRIKISVGRAGDTVQAYAKKMAYDDFQEERFRVLNSMQGDEQIVSGKLYKVIVR